MSFPSSKVSPSTERQQRQSSRLHYAESSWTRWIQIPLFLWVTPILSLANKRTLVDDDLNDLSMKDQCSIILNRVNQYSSKWPGTWNVFNRIFFKDFLSSMLFVLPLSISRIAQPLLVRQIILYIKDESGLPAYSGYLYSIALFIAVIVQASGQRQIIFRNTRVGMRISNALSSTIYKHLLSINTAALHKTTAAQTINLVANDANKFTELSIFMHSLLTVPLEVFSTFGLVWWTIGLPTLFGYAVLLLIIPIQFIFSKKFGLYRKATMACTDKRVQTINELVNGCQIIKIFFTYTISTPTYSNYEDYVHFELSLESNTTKNISMTTIPTITIPTTISVILQRAETMAKTINDYIKGVRIIIPSLLGAAFFSYYLAFISSSVIKTTAVLR
ncbi:unnamed protein product [Adineta steineri]|uniref:ABC transmembrane type-1 domain-containing protein n=1 Tax=Adineta steineri TaxID=433720 RepID=A0A814LYF6_9BILA|nr:unnamed protein product [Adineta steineri]CAF1186118.1 unnamed protein product [Adineta steineri]CAF1290388.1 unnamed protein product [Adineta steineri]